MLQHGELLFQPGDLRCHIGGGDVVQGSDCPTDAHPLAVRYIGDTTAAADGGGEGDFIPENIYIHVQRGAYRGHRGRLGLGLLGKAVEQMVPDVQNQPQRQGNGQHIQAHLPKIFFIHVFDSARGRNLSVIVVCLRECGGPAG